MKTIILLPALLLIFCSSLSAQQAVQTPSMAQQSNAKLSHKIIAAPGNTFGYDIYSNGKLLVHQPSVPGQPGNSGFKTKAAAEKVAELVKEKVRKGEMPPTVTTEELKKLKAI